MSGFSIVALCALAILIGQLTRYYSKRKRVFYIVHLVGVLILIFISMVISKTQSGGVNWPWWFFAILYSVPIFLSFFVGLIQDVLNKQI